MVKLIIMRHAKTAWNLSHRIQGRSDIPLTPDSIALSEGAAPLLNGLDIDCAYCSPLIRARQTAEAVTKGHSIAIIPDERLIERDFGELDGKCYTEMDESIHDRLFLSLDGVNGAESPESVFARAKSFLTDIEKKHSGKTVLVVSHGALISFMIYALSHEKYDEANCTVNYIKNLTLYKAEYGDRI